MIPGGHMVLTIMGSDSKAKSSANQSQRCSILELLGLALNDMVLEGIIEEEKSEQFNMPFYVPAAEEVRLVIEIEGSFNIQRFETFKLNWDAGMEDNIESSRFEKHARGKYGDEHKGGFRIHSSESFWKRDHE